MSLLQICDKVELSATQRKITDEEYLMAPATLSRCGVYDYSSAVCKTMPSMQDIRDKLKLPDTQPLRVYRSPEEVFDEDSMASFAMKPVTHNHPPEWVNAKNAKYYSVGHAGETITRDGIYQKANLLITDEDSIRAINEGKVEISNGYKCDVVQDEGITEEGESYHAKFTNIRGNHIAIVNKGRAGNGCRISDSTQTEATPMKTIVHDGVSYEVSEQAAQIIAKVQGENQAVLDSVETLKTEHKTALAGMQGKIDAEADKVKLAEAKVIDGAELDAMIEARTVLVADAKALVADFDASGKTEPEIIEAVVVAVVDGIDLSKYEGTDRVAYCRARFDACLLAKDTKSDGTEKINVTDAKKDDEDEGDEARKKFIKSTETAYKREAK